MRSVVVTCCMNLFFRLDIDKFSCISTEEIFYVDKDIKPLKKMRQSCKKSFLSVRNMIAVSTYIRDCVCTYTYFVLFLFYFNNVSETMDPSDCCGCKSCCVH